MRQLHGTIIILIYILVMFPEFIIIMEESVGTQKLYLVN